MAVRCADPQHLQHLWLLICRAQTAETVSRAQILSARAVGDCVIVTGPSTALIVLPQPIEVGHVDRAAPCVRAQVPAA